jgi:hypothetical protein
MDTNMEDVKMPEPMQLSSIPSTEPASIPTLDGWIESLMNCKQLAEVDVQRLCDKVMRKSLPVFSENRRANPWDVYRLVRSFRRSPTYSLW